MYAPLPRLVLFKKEQPINKTRNSRKSGSSSRNVAWLGAGFHATWLTQFSSLRQAIKPVIEYCDLLHRHISRGSADLQSEVNLLA